MHAHRFIEALPEGYDTEVKERGATLSVGQKQLLSFARALAHDPRVLILDEATSSVDTETEQLIQDALRVLLRGRTAIVIAHRLSTIQNVDEILVLHKGRIRERGTHQELLARRGLYWRLYQLQYKDQEAARRGAGGSYGLERTPGQEVPSQRRQGAHAEGQHVFVDVEALGVDHGADALRIVPGADHQVEGGHSPVEGEVLRPHLGLHRPPPPRTPAGGREPDGLGQGGVVHRRGVALVEETQGGRGAVRLGDALHRARDACLDLPPAPSRRGCASSRPSSRGRQ